MGGIRPLRSWTAASEFGHSSEDWIWPEVEWLDLGAGSTKKLTLGPPGHFGSYQLFPAAGQFLRQPWNRTFDTAGRRINSPPVVGSLGKTFAHYKRKRYREQG